MSNTQRFRTATGAAALAIGLSSAAFADKTPNGLPGIERPSMGEFNEKCDVIKTPNGYEAYPKNIGGSPHCGCQGDDTGLQISEDGKLFDIQGYRLNDCEDDRGGLPRSEPVRTEPAQPVETPKDEDTKENCEPDNTVDTSKETKKSEDNNVDQSTDEKHTAVYLNWEIKGVKTPSPTFS